MHFKHVMTGSSHLIVSAALEKPKIRAQHLLLLAVFKIFFILLASAVRDCGSACLV